MEGRPYRRDHAPMPDGRAGAGRIEHADLALVPGAGDWHGRAIVAALWPTGVEHEWWQTPLGRVVAAPLADATPDQETIRVSDAARMLGMSHARVVQLADNTGTLARGQAGSSARVRWHSPVFGGFVFEHHAGNAAAAAVILGPDDVGGLVTGNPDELELQPRARKNAVLELVLGQSVLGRVIALLVHDVEQPSDMSGVLCIPSTPAEPGGNDRAAAPSSTPSATDVRAWRRPT